MKAAKHGLPFGRLCVSDCQQGLTATATMYACRFSPPSSRHTCDCVVSSCCQVLPPAAGPGVHHSTHWGLLHTHLTTTC